MQTLGPYDFCGRNPAIKTDFTVYVLYWIVTKFAKFFTNKSKKVNTLKSNTKYGLVSEY